MKARPKTKSLGYEKRTCEQHGIYTAELFEFLPGRTRATICPLCEEAWEAEKVEKKKKEKKELRLMAIRRAGVSKRFMEASFLNFNFSVSKKAAQNLNVIKKYCEKFESIQEKGVSLMLCGRPGTGKTHLASAMAINLVDAGRSVSITTSYQLMSRIKSTYNKQSTETEQYIIKRKSECDLLIIDEVGVQFGSEAEKILFYQIINGRYDNVLPTVLISNLTKEQLKKFIGERCYDRLRDGGGAVLSFDWDSYRK